MKKYKTDDDTQSYFYKKIPSNNALWYEQQAKENLQALTTHNNMRKEFEKKRKRKLLKQWFCYTCWHIVNNRWHGNNEETKNIGENDSMICIVFGIVHQRVNL